MIGGSKNLTDGDSPTTAMSSFLSGSHNVITVSAATASTEPSAEKAAALIALFLRMGEVTASSVSHIIKVTGFQTEAIRSYIIFLLCPTED
jgi:tetrahydromethanopterin S-methyltransferase subunit H